MTCAVMSSGSSRRAANGASSMARRRSIGWSTRAARSGCRWWCRRDREVLAARQDPGLAEAFGKGAGEADDAGWILGERARADHGIGRVVCTSSTGAKSTSKPSAASSIRARGRFPPRCGARRVLGEPEHGGPDGRGSPNPLHGPPLLIDADEEGDRRGGGVERVVERQQRVDFRDVVREQDDRTDLLGSDAIEERLGGEVPGNPTQRSCPIARLRSFTSG